MILLGSPGTRRVIAGLFGRNLKPRVSLLVAIAVATVAWAFVRVAASFVDGTLTLPSPGRGLSNHYGFQVSFLAIPLVLTTVYYALSYFLRLLQNIDDLAVKDADPEKVRNLVTPHVDSLFLRGRWRNMLWLFMVVGAGTFIVMFKQLDIPLVVWGNDVFNAPAYRYGYFAGNLVFALLWFVVYPVGIFYALHLTISAELIVAQLQRRSWLKLDFLNVDRCGGMARFGTVNFLVMLIYLWPALAIIAFQGTHQNTYLTLIVTAIGMSLLLIVQSTYGMYHIARAITSERKMAVSQINSHIENAMSSHQKDFQAALASMEYRNCVMSVSPLPHSRSILAAVNATRFAPTAVAALSWIGSRFSG
jgi:hypothetical protein